MATLLEYTTQDSTYSFTPSTIYDVYQQFTATANATLSAVYINAVSLISTKFYVGLYIYGDNGSDRPNLSDPKGGSYTINETSPGWVGGTLSSSATLVNGTKYWIRVDNLGGTNDGANLGIDSNEGYNHVSLKWNGSDYDVLSHDFNFRLTGTLASPEKPTDPTPENNDTEVDFSGLTLSWVDGGGADTYDVWVGDSVDLYRVSEGQAGTSYVTNLTEVSSAYDGKIYWEIDATNDVGTTEGDIWNFDARPGQVSTFTPLNEATGLTLSSVGSTWESPSGNTDSYNVYFGIESGSLAFVDNTTGLLLDLVSVFPIYNYTYYWDIDAVNDFGITAGNEVSFSTIAFYPPLPTGITLDGDGIPTGTPTGESNMITIRKLIVAANDKIWVEDI